MTFLEIMRTAMGMPPNAKSGGRGRSRLDLKPASPLQAAPSREEFSLLEERATNGDAASQFQLSSIYYRGMGVQRDDAECLLWLTLAAEQGHPQAMADYGIVIQGFEPETIVEAREMLEAFTGPRNILMPEFQPPEVDPRSIAARRSGAADAAGGPVGVRQPARKTTVGTMASVAAQSMPSSRSRVQPQRRSRGWGWVVFGVVVLTAAGLWMFVFNVPKPKKSVEAGKAANHAAKPAALDLPDLPKEISTAMDLADFAKIKDRAEKGERMAQFSLGLAYAKGVGVPQNYDLAREWYIKSAEQDWPNAQNNLGVMYVTGTGVPIDYVQAYKWFYLASRNIKGAIQNRNQVAMIMPAEQLAEALRQANATVKRFTKSGPSPQPAEPAADRN